MYEREPTEEFRKILGDLDLELAPNYCLKMPKPNGEDWVLELGFEELTFMCLQEISKLFKTKNINVVGGKAQYYGDYDTAVLAVTMPCKVNWNRFYLSEKETEKLRKVKKRATEKKTRSHLIYEAKRAGLTFEDLK